MNEKFKEFVNTFDMNEKFIKLKYDHSLRVQKKCEMLGKKEKLDHHDFLLCSLIGLLHDYGRFYQWSRYKTFCDDISVDHGDYAAEELINNRKITNFYKEKKDYKIIYEAIKYHNKYKVPENVISKTLCNIIRDADKLDIIEMYKTGELIFKEEGEITEEVKNNFFNNNLVDNRNINSNVDIAVRTLSLIYDLNYKYSFIYLKENKILDSIYEKVKDKNKLNPYFKQINNYIESKIK